MPSDKEKESWTIDQITKSEFWGAPLKVDTKLRNKKK